MMSERRGERAAALDVRVDFFEDLAQARALRLVSDGARDRRKGRPAEIRVAICRL
jgi:hypothetical protein